MDDIFNILDTLETDINADIPALILAAGLDAFDIISQGGSRNAKQKGFFIYLDNFKWDYENNFLSLIFQLQLYRVDEIVSSQYIDVVFNYLKEYDVSKLGMVLTESIECDEWPADASSVTFIYFSVAYQEELDSCD